MRKIDKKIENQLIASLNEACNTALDKYHGFKWLTHFIDYSDFPRSLLVVCVFDTNENLSKMYSSDGGDSFRELIFEKLTKIGIKPNDIKKSIYFDTEEKCQKEDNGKWKDRFHKLHL